MKTSEIINELCRIKEISVSELEKSLGFGNASLSKDGSLRSDRLLKVAEYFGVTMEYLMNCESNNPLQGISPKALEIARMCESLNDEGCEKVFAYVSDLCGNARYIKNNVNSLVEKQA